MIYVDHCPVEILGKRHWYWSCDIIGPLVLEVNESTLGLTIHDHYLGIL